MPDDPPLDSAASIAYLRARGVEIELPEERAAARAAAVANPGADGGRPFCFVRIPAETTSPVEELSSTHAGSSDVLPRQLAPRFSDDATLDEATVARETAGRMKGMLIGGGNGDTLAPPSASALQQQALGGVCEAWPLSQASADNDWRAVRFYIDEVGALRGRPRNPRAEALAAVVGLGGVSLHGDAFVGRCERRDEGGGGEVNVDFGLVELAHDSPWVLASRRSHEAQAQAAGIGAEEHLASGGDGEGGLYTWTQGEDDVEVRVTRGIPEGKAAKKRVAVSYGSGESLTVKVDGAVVLAFPRLFDRVTPDECSWSLGGDGALVITIEKAEARPWADLPLPGHEPIH